MSHPTTRGLGQMRGLRNVRPKVDLRAGKYARDDYNTDGTCRRPAGTSVAIEEMDWSSMTEDYVCFTETFDADAEILELCADVVSDAASISSSNDKNSDDNSLALILGVVGAVVVVGVVIAVMKRRKPTKPPSEDAPPVAAVVHEPTAPPQPELAPIKAMALEMITARETALTSQRCRPSISGRWPQPQPLIAAISARSSRTQKSSLTQ